MLAPPREDDQLTQAQPKRAVVGIVEPRVVVKIPWRKVAAENEEKENSSLANEESRGSSRRAKRKRRSKHKHRRHRKSSGKEELGSSEANFAAAADLSRRAGEGKEEVRPGEQVFRITETLPEHFKQALRTTGSLSLLRGHEEDPGVCYQRQRGGVPKRVDAVEEVSPLFARSLVQSKQKVDARSLEEEEGSIGGEGDGERKDAIDAGVGGAIGGRKRKQRESSESLPGIEEEGRKKRKRGRPRKKPEGKLNPLKLIRRFMPGSNQEKYEIDDGSEPAATETVDLAAEEDREEEVATSMATVGVSKYMKARMPHLLVSPVISERARVKLRRLSTDDIARHVKLEEDYGISHQEDERVSLFGRDLLESMKSFGDIAKSPLGGKSSINKTCASERALPAGSAGSLVCGGEPLFARSRRQQSPGEQLGFLLPFRHSQRRRKEAEEPEGVGERVIYAAKKRAKGSLTPGDDYKRFGDGNDANELARRLQRWKLDEKSDKPPSNAEEYPPQGGKKGGKPVTASVGCEGEKSGPISSVMATNGAVMEERGKAESSATNERGGDDDDVVLDLQSLAGDQEGRSAAATASTTDVVVAEESDRGLVTPDNDVAAGGAGLGQTDRCAEEDGGCDSHASPSAGDEAMVTPSLDQHHQQSEDDFSPEDLFDSIMASESVGEAPSNDNISEGKVDNAYPLSMPILFSDEANVQDLSTLLLGALNDSPLEQNQESQDSASSEEQDRVQEIEAQVLTDSKALPPQQVHTSTRENAAKEDDDDVLCLTPLPSSSSSLTSSPSPSKRGRGRPKKRTKPDLASQGHLLPETPPPEAKEASQVSAVKVVQEADADGVTWMHCPVSGCEFYTRKPWKMDRHRRCHADSVNSPRSFVCPDCGEKFNSLARFLRHDRREHTSEQDYECKICEAEVTDINVHMRVSSSFPFKATLSASFPSLFSRPNPALKRIFSPVVDEQKRSALTEKDTRA